MTGGQYDGIEDILGPVSAWRLREFLRLGFNADDAELLTLEHQVDLHQVEALIKAGCPHGLVMRIVI